MSYGRSPLIPNVLGLKDRVLEEKLRHIINRINFLFVDDEDEWHLVGDTGEPAFENSWVNAGGGYEDVGFRMDRSGYVHLKGRAQDGTVDTTIFTLPSRYRPSSNQLFSVPYEDTTAYILVQSDGQVKMA